MSAVCKQPAVAHRCKIMTRNCARCSIYLRVHLCYNTNSSFSQAIRRVLVRPLPTGTVTLLFTDIEGSTRLLRRLGSRYAEVLAECRALLRAAFAQWQGHEVDTQGDAFFVAFTRAIDAVSAALAIQRSLHAHQWPDDAKVRVRIGVHTGEPQSTDEGYIGMDVHRAARIM